MLSVPTPRYSPIGPLRVVIHARHERVRGRVVQFAGAHDQGAVRSNPGGKGEAVILNPALE